MKRHFFILTIICLAFACTKKTEHPITGNFTLKGKFGKGQKWVVSYRDSAYNQINDTLLLGSDSLSYKAIWQEPTIVRLTRFTHTEPTDSPIFLMVEQPETILLTQEAGIGIKISDYQGKRDWDNYQKWEDSLSLQEKKLLQANEPIDNALLDAIEEKKTQTAKTFIQQHPNSLTSVYLAGTYLIDNEPQALQNYIDQLQPERKKGKYARFFKDMLANLKTLAIGQKAPDFTQNDASDKPVSLHDFQGKYILIDFWASWCGPCRRENPNVVAAYQKYHSKGFEILGISLDKDKENWLTAIKEDGLGWSHVSDLKYWNNSVARLYNVRTIPRNMLIDPQGIIIASNLRGKELENKLSEIFP